MSAPANTQTDPASFGDPPAKEVRTGAEKPRRPSKNILLRIGEVFASLKLTVALMALGIVIIFIGTLAQTTADIWEVMGLYFRAWIMWVPLELFFPQSFFPHAKPWFPQRWAQFPFPGGATVGILMMINLFSAHIVRFKTLGKGQAIAIGSIIMAVGAVIAGLVVVSGNLSTLQDTPIVGWGWLWAGMLILLAVICAVSWCGAAYTLLSGQQNQMRLAGALGLSLVAVCTSALLGYAVMYPEQARLADSSSRILWQLAQCIFAASVLLVGAWFVFRQRAGIVVLHLGIALLMVEQVVVAWFAVESQITLLEGETTNFSRDQRSTELAFIDSSDPENDQQTVVNSTALLRSLRNNSAITSDELPVNVRVLKYYQNSDLRRPKASDTNLATTGTGIEWVADSAPSATGVDAASTPDMAAAYVSLTDKKTNKDLGTFLVSVVSAELVDKPETITVDGKDYAVALRYKRLYKDYTITLVDVKKDDYPGTETPRNYSSDIILTDKSRNVEFPKLIWMNNPLRYGGETFYQSGYVKTPQGERTTLQIVSNTGWMIPYMALSFVGVGMLLHFVLTLVRFLDRISRGELAPASTPEWVAATARSGAAPANPFSDSAAEALPPPERKESKKKKPKPDEADAPTPVKHGIRWQNFIGPVLVAVLFFMFIGRIGRVPKPSRLEFDFVAAGRLPCMHEGRCKPLDTFARNQLRIISNEETYKEFASDENFKKGIYKRQPAMKWLLDTITDKRKSFQHKVVRIENQEVLFFFGQETRSGFLRYSLDELLPKMQEFQEQLAKVSKREGGKEKSLSTYEKKLGELETRLKSYMVVMTAFEPVGLPPLPSKEEVAANPGAAQQRFFSELQMTRQGIHDRTISMKLPLVIPLEKKNADGDNWQAYSDATLVAQIEAVRSKPDEAIILFNEILDAYAKNEPGLFNQKVEEYQRKIVDARQPEHYSASKVNLESYFNYTSPFFWGMWICLGAFLLSGIGIVTSIFGDKSMRYSATTLIILVFCLYSAALLGRLIISGRPPVTNLYSSAIFIGWAGILLGLGIEFMFKIGVGNLGASWIGFVTMLIASWLAVDGDTFTVLQAVLDTQFWLATHVTSITLGYAATFKAGLIGICLLATSAVLPIFVSNKVMTKDDEKNILKVLGWIVYGFVCFAMFFSFVGTVLGGLWADDSWGRFWGWDPKENGALMIVLWNALVLHARWDKLVGDRGLAVLAIGGNIITAWSWFGVNELGAGLHSYGFTEGRAFWLGIVVLIHLALIAGGIVLCIAQRKPELRRAEV